ncbi:hypothetical protein B0H14DRAFT_3890617 [Mycena olivaceomarginata]|nr:hypothetical protein B0H14DRAFT_3890617 [Mycena olivaceomarginata]
MNDTTSTLYIKYAANHLALDVVAVVTAALGVIAAVVTGGILVLAISAPVILAALGVGGGVLSLAALVTGSIDLSAKEGGYHAVAPGGTYRSEKLTLSLIHQADVKLTSVVDDITIDMWSGSFTVVTGPTAGSTKKYKMSQQLSHLDHQRVSINDNSNPLDLAQSLFENFTRVHYETSGTGLQEKLAVQQSCSLSDLE